MVREDVHTEIFELRPEGNEEGESCATVCGEEDSRQRKRSSRALGKGRVWRVQGTRRPGRLEQRAGNR